MASTFTPSTPYSTDNPKVQRLNSLLVKLLCKEGLPFRLVDSEAFREFVHELDPRYTLPTRQVVSAKLIPNKFTEVKSDIQTKLSAVKSCSLTADMWTSSSNDSYLGVTAHWLDDNFNVESHCLTVRPAPGSHTADFLEKEISTVLDDWSLREKELFMVTDSGANIKKAMTHMDTVTWRPCFAHTLQLCVNAGLSNREVTELPKLLAKARAIVGHFRRSPLATSQLLQAQKQLDIPQHKLLQDCATRWNSQVCTVV